jgi:hypothetical protein
MKFRVGQQSQLMYMVHQYKNFIGSCDFCTIELVGRSSLAPSYSAVNLQVFNRQSLTWETKATENETDAYDDFELTVRIPDVTNYKDSQHIVSTRVYQLAVQ